MRDGGKYHLSNETVCSSAFESGFTEAAGKRENINLEIASSRVHAKDIYSVYFNNDSIMKHLCQSFGRLMQTTYCHACKLLR